MLAGVGLRPLDEFRALPRPASPSADVNVWVNTAGRIGIFVECFQGDWPNEKAPHLLNSAVDRDFIAAAPVIRKAVDELTDEVERLRAVIGEHRHIVDVAETEFGLQHPVECRPHLLDCAVGKALHALAEPPMPVGRYVVAMDEQGGLSYSDLDVA